MSFLTAFVVASSSPERVAEALRQAVVTRGGVEREGGERLAIRIGEPEGGWIVVTDSTRYTFDMKVAAAAAEGLAVRAAVVGIRGLDEDGVAKVVSYGPWEDKPKATRQGAAEKLLRKLGVVWPRPWEVETRAGIELVVDASAMKRAPGPFADKPSDQRTNEQGEQLDAAQYIASGDERGLTALRDRWGWQSAFDRMIAVVQQRGARLPPATAKLVLRLARTALEDTTARTLFDRWLTVVGDRTMKAARLAVPIVSAIVSEDAALGDYVAKLDDDELRPRVALFAHAFAAPLELGERLEAVLPRAPAMAWALAQLRDRTLYGELARIAATGERDVFDRVVEQAVADPIYANDLAQVAFDLAHLELLDRAVATGSLYSYCHGSVLATLLARPPIDPARARTYLAACERHAADCNDLYMSIAAVHVELGDTAAARVALAKLAPDLRKTARKHPRLRAL